MRRSILDLSRRQFLAKSAGFAGASLGLRGARSETVGAAPAALERREVRVGICGLGDRGRDLLSAALASRSARVVALCDSNPLHLKRAVDMARAHRPRGFTAYPAMLDSSAMEAVIIATPVYLHSTQTVAALATEKHVYCEKPVALDVAGCAEVVEACRDAEKRGLVYQSGLQRRYSPRYRAAVERIHSGEAGGVLFVRAQWHAVGAARKDKPWLFRRDRSGDIMVEQACHQFDIFNWVFASVPTSACGLGGVHQPRTGPPRRSTRDHYGIVLEYPGGGKVHYSHLTYSIRDRRFAGIYELVFCERTGVDLQNALTWDSDGRTRELCTERGNDTRLALDAFFGCVLAGTRPEANVDVAANATFSALLCRKALDNGARARWEDLAGNV